MTITGQRRPRMAVFTLRGTISLAPGGTRVGLGRISRTLPALVTSLWLRVPLRQCALPARAAGVRRGA